MYTCRQARRTVTVPGICMARDQLCTLFIHTCVGWQPNDFDFLFFLSYFYHLVGFRCFCEACGTLWRRDHFSLCGHGGNLLCGFRIHCGSRIASRSQVTPASDTIPQVYSTLDQHLTLTHTCRRWTESQDLL